MITYTQYFYSFTSATITLRVIEHLRRNYQSTLDSVTVINFIDSWVIKINLKPSIPIELTKNLRAFLNEMGAAYKPSRRIAKALAKLEAGESPTEIMNNYRLVIVTYGKPETKEIEVFRQQIIKRLGYCPQSMV